MQSVEEDDQVGELDPLFFQPGKPGQYSIRVGPETPSRINAYRNVGRLEQAVKLLCFLPRHQLSFLSLNFLFAWFEQGDRTGFACI